MTITRSAAFKDSASWPAPAPRTAHRTLPPVALAICLGGERLISVELGALSAGGVVPALIGMVLGQRLRRHLSEAVFRRVFFGALLLLGLYILIHSIGWPSG